MDGCEAVILLLWTNLAHFEAKGVPATGGGAKGVTKKSTCSNCGESGHYKSTCKKTKV